MTDENVIRIALLTATVMHGAIRIHYLRRSGAGASLLKHRQAGALLTWAIALSYAAYVLIMVAYLIQPNWTAWSSVVVAAWMRWPGLIILLMGCVVVVRGFSDLGSNFTISPSTKKSHQLVTTGVYR